MPALRLVLGVELEKLLGLGLADADDPILGKGLAVGGSVGSGGGIKMGVKEVVVSGVDGAIDDSLVSVADI